MPSRLLMLTLDEENLPKCSLLFSPTMPVLDKFCLHSVMRSAEGRDKRDMYEDKISLSRNIQCSSYTTTVCLSVKLTAVCVDWWHFPSTAVQFQIFRALKYSSWRSDCVIEQVMCIDVVWFCSFNFQVVTGFTFAICTRPHPAVSLPQEG